MIPPILHVLHVEDDVGDIEMFRIAADRANVGARFIVARDGEEALQALNSNDPSGARCPHVILLDLNMPRRDGRMLLTDIKQDPRWKLIPVLVYTTSNDPQDISECYSKGASCYIVKPSELSELQLLVESLFAFWGMVELPRSHSAT